MSRRVKIIPAIAIAAVYLAIGMGIPAAQVAASDESSVDAEVDVVATGEESYGAKVVKSRFTLLPRWALGEPDGRGSYILRGGWVVIELEDSLPDANKISIWAGRLGWSPASMKIYVSADGRRWRKVGNATVKSTHFRRYDFSGSFGDARYIKVSRSGGRWSWLRLDAVSAKGGD